MIARIAVSGNNVASYEATRILACISRRVRYQLMQISFDSDENVTRVLIDAHDITLTEALDEDADHSGLAADYAKL